MYGLAECAGALRNSSGSFEARLGAQQGLKRSQQMLVQRVVCSLLGLLHQRRVPLSLAFGVAQEQVDVPFRAAGHFQRAAAGTRPCRLHMSSPVMTLPKLSMRQRFRC